MISLKDIEQARQRIGAYVHNTPLMLSETLSEAVNARVYLKLESLQKTGAFKVRGIYNKILSSTPQDQQAGFVTASSGNHGLGLAYVCRELGFKATIVVPLYTPAVKCDAIRRYGAELILDGGNWNDSYHRAEEIAADTGKTLIHPFDDEAVICGQGSMAFEILNELKNPTYFLASIGGGSMIASNAMVFKSLSPQTKVIGLQAYGADAMYQSVQQGSLVKLENISSKIESFATKVVSEKTYTLAKAHIDEFIHMSDKESMDAMLYMLERSNVLLELSASICVAALLNGKLPLKPDDSVVIVLCGGNYDLMKLADDIHNRNM